ncbi:YchJ family protein [Motilibacter deserti]|uniref:UPF0225 protein G9H71_04575 n=1 Tax=Motilibacter deserti TaxID=2714956 RepID=A0ABX0GTQ9_9ACTN|nr:YchJ family metal-binding protein [Motilibacter deserti]NHC13052.1 hypothetical protein [Motilibacter deserti]
MSRRAPVQLPHDAPCPCGLGLRYAECCGRLHRGEAQAATAELLMRSRYSAFAVRDEAYLLASWHPSTRPRSVDLPPGLEWTGLEVLEREAGGPFDTEGVVSFEASYREDGHPGRLAERSRFRRENGAWLYLAALPSLDRGSSRR